jgi:SAM-dependent methyltransferase
VTADAFWEFERAGWERAAGSYEECWTDTELFVDALLEAAQVHAHSDLLDVVCGPGFVSEAAARRGAHPVGLDVASAMVERARQRCPDLEFVEGDAERLPFDAARFNAYTMNFGVLHLSEPEVALREARRVLRVGGWLAFTVWVAEGHAADAVVDAAVKAHAIAIELPEGPPAHRFADPDESRRALGEAGFDTNSFRAETITATWRIPTPEFLFEAHMRAGVRVAGALHAQPPERLAAIRAAIIKGVRRYAADADFALPIVARLISAQVGTPSS